MKPAANTIVYYRDGFDPSANAAAQKIADEYFSGRTEPLLPVLEDVSTATCSS